MLRKLSRRNKAFQSDKNEEKEEKDLKDHLESPKDFTLLGEQKEEEVTGKIKLDKSSINSNFIFDNISIHISKQNENLISNFCKEKMNSISSDLRAKLQNEPFPILKQQLENGRMSDLKFVNKRDGLKEDPNVINYKILKCEAQSETDSDNKENATNVEKQVALNKELHFTYEPQPITINNSNNHSFLLEALQPFHLNNLHNLEEDKPCDLSMKSGMKVDKTENEIESVEKDAEDDILNTEDFLNNDNDNERDDDNISEYNIKYNGLSTQQQQQQLVLAQLSKIQQHFVSNLLQYQANFLAHYQQIQQRIMLNCNSSNDESSQDDEDRANEELQDCTDSDVDKDDESQKEKSSSLIPPPLIPLALLGGLVPYAIYRHLLPASSENASLASLLSNSSAFQQESEGDDKLNSDENSSSGTSHLFRTSLFQQLIKRSDEFSSSKLNELTSDKKCSILRTLIGSSRHASDSSSNVKLEEGVDESGSSSFQFKRKRIAFSAKQYELLQTTFEHNNFPEPGDQQCIARQLKAPYRSIKMWFQNKRANARKKLFPGEKGSGRTATGEKIPGDTDTRFYCDKCPSAFICQKYLKNHLDAHKVYTKSCPKCRVNFTHDCLLNTHTISKCGKKEDKLSNKESDEQETIVKEEEEELEEEETFLKINGFHGSRLPSQRNEDKEELTNNIMTHLNSSLPLLTLLQIQKTKAEQNFNEQSDEFEQETSDEEKEDYIEQNLDQNVMTSESSITNNKNAVYQKEVPPLIPTELVKPFVNNVTKFAILRQLLTNFEQKSQDTKSVVSADEDDIFPTTESVNDTSDEEMDIRVPENEFKPKNIPEHLYNVLNNRNSTYKHDDNNEQTFDEYDDTQRSAVISESELSEKRNLESLFNETEGNLGNKPNHGSKPKRLRRRTTVFTENQHRVLYLHFTHCNFPDPSMFRILSKLTGLTPHVIKIWFQNERSRQRRQVQNSEGDGVPRDKKPYKCRDCGVEFAMPAFLVKHCMRHIPTENVTSQARKCPICMVEFETQKLHSHFMASHNLSINIEDDGTNEENICHLCKEHFSDLNSLSIHKNEHLKDTQYGDPPQCCECKTTFVNVLCLEAHMATHYKFKWDHSCPKCKMRFYDKILLESHLISHTMHGTNNANSKSAPSLNNDSQSQFLISLIKKIADSESESAKLASSEKDSVKCVDADKRKRDVTERIVSIKVESNVSKEKDSLSLNGCDVALSQVIPPLSIPVSTSLSSVSLKIIPVKFVSTPSYSQVISSDSNPVVTAQFLTSGISSGNISSNSVNSQGGPIAPSNSNPFIKKDLSLPVEEEKVPASTFCSPTKRKVPNLIPISKSGFHPQICDDISNEEHSKYDNQKENSCDNEIDESSETTPSEESPDSQVLVYTPYASEYRKRRRTPTHFNSSQRDILEAYYKYDNFPDPNEQLHLSEYLKVPYSVIKTWYQNTRKNHRKHLKESLNFEVGGPFECLDCRVCFVSKIYLESHIRQHKEKQPFNCLLCFRQFPHQAVYDIHTRMGCSKKSKKKHEQIRPFSSLTKNFKLGEKEDRTKKMSKDSAVVDSFSGFVNSHGQKRKLGFSSKESNIKYLKFEYEDKGKEQIIAFPLKVLKREDSESTECLSTGEETNFRCDSCHSCFPSLQSLSDHHCTNYVPQVLGYKCPECGKTFQSFLSIAEHKERHCKKLLPILPAPKVTHKDGSHFASSKLVCSELIHLYPSEAINRDSKSSEVCLSTKIKEKLGFSRSNICFLQVHYKYNNFPSVKEMELMSKRLGIEREKVEHWFLRQRSRERKGSVGYKSAHECKSCPSIFVHSDGLKKHEDNVHNPSTISIEFFCPQEYCKAKYPNATLLQTHQMEHSSDQSTKEEKNGRSVLHHLIPLEMHYKENNFPSSAEMTFIAKRLRLDLIHVHCWFKQRREDQMALLHNGTSKTECTPTLSDHQPPFLSSSSLPASIQGKECKVCFAKFVKEDMLKNHQLIHTTNYSLVCWECGFDSASPVVLKTHMLQHDYPVPSDVLSSSKIVAVNSTVEMKYTFIQLQILYNHFKITNFPRKDEIKLISRRLKVPMKHVQTWFKYQRISELAYSKTGSSTVENSASAETSTPGGHSSSASQSLSRSCKSSSNGLALSKLESSSLFCGLCSSDFVSTRMLERHKALHALGRSYFCDSCSSVFLHEMIRDTHTLSHSANGKSGNASELGLKARSKILEKETKALLKSLILTCRDIPAPTLSLGSCNNTPRVVGQINTDIGSTSLILNNKGTNKPTQALTSEFEKLQNTSTCNQNSPVDSEEQNVLTDCLKYDSENDEEDDEIKLVIDE